MKAKLNMIGSPGLPDHDWAHITGRVLMDMAFPENDKNSQTIYGERLHIESVGKFMEAAKRCSTYFIAGASRGYKRCDAEKVLEKQPKETSSCDESQPQFNTVSNDWWFPRLRILLTLGERLWVYHRLVAVRADRPQLCLGDLAEAALGERKRQTNLSDTNKFRSEPDAQLALAAAYDADCGQQWLNAVHEVCKDVSASTSDEEGMKKVASALLAALQNCPIEKEYVNSEALRGALNNIKQVAGNLSSADIDLTAAALQYQDALRETPSQIDRLEEWLQKLPCRFREIERDPQDVLNNIFKRPVQHNIEAVEQSLSADSRPDGKSQNIRDTAVDPIWIREQMFAHFNSDGAKDRCCHEITCALIIGKVSFDDMRKSISPPPPNELEETTLEELQKRLGEWQQWIERPNKASDVINGGRIDAWIVDEIPKSAMEKPQLVQDAIDHVKEWSIDMPGQPANWDAVSTDVAEVIRWAVFSVFLELVNTAFKKHYEKSKESVNERKAAEREAKKSEREENQAREI